jgi:hypothetical protein
MAGFKQKPNYDFMKEFAFTQIRVNKYTVDFVWPTMAAIAMATTFDHYSAETKRTVRYDIESFPKEFTAQAIIEVPITDVEIVSDDVLKLTFENGDTLTLLRMNDGYESMTIGGPNGIIVIY